MAWYDIIKDTLKLADTVKNQDLYDKLMELRQAVSEMQDVIDELKDKNKTLQTELEELKRIRITEEDIERHEEAYITLKSDPKKIKYCANCFSTTQKLIQFQKCGFTNEDAECPICHTKILYLFKDENRD